MSVALCSKLNATIHGLPSEVLSMVFEAVPNPPPSFAATYPYALEKQWPVDIPFELLVSQVSSYWRQVAINTPAIWADIRIDTETSLEAIKTYLLRSGSVPLDICLDIGDMDGGNAKSLAQVAIINPEVRRWHRLRIRAVDTALFPVIFDPITTKYQRLRVLSILVLFKTSFPQYPVIFTGGAPVLSFLRLKGYHMNQFRPPLSSVTTFHLDHIRQLPSAMAFPNFWGLLSTMPNLENLSVDSNAVITGPDELMAEVDLPALRHLRITISTSEESAHGLLAAIVAPLLESFYLKVVDDADDAVYDEYWGPCTSPLDRFPMLRSLTLKDYAFSRSSLFKLAAASHKITKLTVLTTKYSSFHVEDLMAFLDNSRSMFNHDNGPPWRDLHTLQLDVETLKEAIGETSRLRNGEVQRGSSLQMMMSARIDEGVPIANLRLQGEIEDTEVMKWLRERAEVEQCDEPGLWPPGPNAADDGDIF